MTERVWAVCFSLIIITLILASLSYCQNNDRLIAETLKSGVDPMAVHCAFKPSPNTQYPSLACQNYLNSRRP